MAFERLDSIVSRVVGRVMNEVAGEGSVAAEPNAEIAKKGPDRSPAKFQGGDISQEAIVGTLHREPPLIASRAHTDTTLPMGRRMTVATASPKAEGSPTRAAVIRLVIDNGGGGPARTQGWVRPGRLRASTGGGSREREFLKLVVG